MSVRANSAIVGVMLHERGERVLDIGGLRLAALCYGPEDGVPALAMHGWLDNAASFSRLAEHLSGLNLVALEHAGHGRSQHRPDGVYPLVDFVADAAAAIAALGWERCVVIGHSLGAAVATLLAGTCPERVMKVVALEGLTPLTTAEEDAPQLLREAIAAEAAARGREEHAGYPDAGVVARRLAAQVGMRVDSAEVLLRRGLQRHGDLHRWRADPRLRLPSRMRLTDGQVLAFLRAIACPTLVVRARPGMPIDESMLQGRFAAIADATLVHVEGGHHVHLDEPAAVAAVVQPFIDRDLPSA